MLLTVPIPDFVNEPIRCAALAPEDEAFFFGNTIEILDGTTRKRIPVSDYRTFTNEHLVAHSHAKRSLFEGRSYMVGALARLTLNGDRIRSRTADHGSAELKFPCANIVMNNIAGVELVYSVEHAHDLIQELFEAGYAAETPYRTGKACASGGNRSPRGTLFSTRLTRKG